MISEDDFKEEEIEEVKKDRKKYVARFLRYITTAKNIKQINEPVRKRRVRFFS